MNTLFAIKKATHQHWTASGKRIPVTVLFLQDNVVVSKTDDKTIIGFSKKKLSRSSKPQLGMLKKSNIAYGVRTIREVTGTLEKQAGDMIVPSDVFSVGDIVKVTGTSKGLGFAGVVKRHGFAGGPKTHGQSDRERAPGSIGNRTTPGRVFRNKRMAGRGGNKTVTVENLQVVALNNDTKELWVKGVVPGAISNTVTITKVSDGKFEGLFERSAKQPVIEIVGETIVAETPIAEVSTQEAPKEEVKATEPKEKKKEKAE
ncbi:MAG: 50S ribosomal protein L3 [Candidatus Pacebacteria bacterium]|nr:50S ribosomal protein L3 [Candidatus Paceibacterota bacterium]